MTVTQSATTKDGKKVSATGTLHFAVGIDAASVAASLGKVPAAAGTDGNTDPGYTIVGRTPDGKPCDLKATGLPGSGENGESGDTGIASQTNQGLVVGAFAVLGLAGALLVARRRRG